MDVFVEKLTPDRVDDFFRFFDEIAFADHPEWGCECYCCFFHAASKQEWKDRTVAENKVIARQMILSGRMQGLLAYVDDKPVGWCHYDRKDSLPGLAVFYPQVIGANGPVAAIVCFTIAQGYRGKGIASRLLDTACQDLASQGYPVVEAYPFLANTSDEENYHGPLAMYLSHGFTQTKEIDDLSIVRKML